MARFTAQEILEATKAHTSAVGPGNFSAVCTDTRALVPGALFVALEGERFDAHRFLGEAAKGGAAGAIVRRGKARAATPDGFALFEVDSTLTALGALGLAHRRRFQKPLGAVGGSNGKTTTKEMVGAILATRGPALKTEGNFNNEIGVPLTLFRLEETHVAAVVELGMNHAGEMARLTAIAEPDAALLTVVQPEHLEGLGSLEGVARAEGELFLGLKASATAVVNLDDPLIVEQAKQSGARSLGFGRHPEAAVRLLSVEARGLDGLTATLRHAGMDHPVRLGFIGEHNAQNATGAFAMGLALGYRPEECVAGLEAARPYARRLNVLTAPGGVTVIDDCYNANPASMEAALATLQGLARNGRAIAELGDMLELGGGEDEAHRELGARAAALVQRVAFFGPRSASGAAAAKGITAGAESRHFTEVEPLVAWLKPELKSGDVVLVKGSRGMRLERVVAALTGHAAGGAH
jgi:UDP-N-acetylmuramoyl-tripeptide--D-alanyl-D-alanine ligase